MKNLLIAYFTCCLCILAHNNIGLRLENANHVRAHTKQEDEKAWLVSVYDKTLEVTAGDIAALKITIANSKKTITEKDGKINGLLNVIQEMYYKILELEGDKSKERVT